MNPTTLGRVYGLAGEVMDYERGGDGLLVTTGSGMAMAVMDLCPRLGWAIDLGGGRPVTDAHRAWLEACAHSVSICVAVLCVLIV